MVPAPVRSLKKSLVLDGSEIDWAKWEKMGFIWCHTFHDQAGLAVTEVELIAFEEDERVP